MEGKKMKCPICNNEMSVYDVDQSYYLCKNCNSVFKDVKPDANIEIDLHKNNTLKSLESDLIHYSTKLKNVIDFFKSKNIDGIIDFGGGIPKLPILICNDIIVIDIFADKWKNIFNDVSEVINKYVSLEEKNVRFIKDNFLKMKSNNIKAINNFIKKHNNILVSLIHVTEHITVEEIKKFLNLIRNLRDSNKDVNIYFLIYGPNVERFKTKNWLHNIIDHYTLMSIDKYKEFISEYDFEVIESNKIDEDLCIIFI